MSARLAWREACARYWWKAYLKSSDSAQAYAAWVLFLRSADRRIWVWMQDDIETAAMSGVFFRLKMMHFALNQNKVEGALKKQEKNLEQHFLFRKVAQNVGPWI